MLEWLAAVLLIASLTALAALCAPYRTEGGGRIEH